MNCQLNQPSFRYNHHNDGEELAFAPTATTFSATVILFSGSQAARPVKPPEGYTLVAFAEVIAKCNASVAI